MMNSDEYYMQLALEEAEKAYEKQEVPIGCVLVRDGIIISKNHNQTIEMTDPTAHAEILALREAAAFIGNYRLGSSTTVYCTLEPCLMCIGALLQARIGQLIVAAKDTRSCSIHRIHNFYHSPHMNHHVAFKSGLLAEKAEALLRQFFKQRRKNGESHSDAH